MTITMVNMAMQRRVGERTSLIIYR